MTNQMRGLCPRMLPLQIHGLGQALRWSTTNSCPVPWYKLLRWSTTKSYVHRFPGPPQIAVAKISNHAHDIFPRRNPPDDDPGGTPSCTPVGSIT